MKNATIFLVIIGTIVLVTLGVILMFSDNGGSWVCQDGAWVAKGTTNQPQPTTGCGNSDVVVKSFAECMGAGYAVMESYPRQCKDSDGQVFVEDIGNILEKINLIILESPLPNQSVSSPLVIKGAARGYWYFEADFPVKLFGQNGDLLAQAPATAQSEWMTEDFVPFELVLEFDSTGNEYGVLILERDNPSGLAENDDSLIIPLDFN